MLIFIVNFHLTYVTLLHAISDIYKLVVEYKNYISGLLIMIFTCKTTVMLNSGRSTALELFFFLVSYGVFQTVTLNPQFGTR